MRSRYVLFPEKGKIEVREEELSDKDLSANEVLLESECSIISPGTELARLAGLENYLDFPVRPGYGCIGRILGKGPSVQDFKEGDRVFYAGKHASIQRFTHNQDHQWGRLYACPQNLEPEKAVFACMAQIAMTAPNITELDLGDSVAVFGLGLVGNFASQLYALRGARVLALDPQPFRAKIAGQCGLAEVLEVSPENQLEAVKERTAGEGAHVCVDAVGHSKVIQQAVASCRLHGQVLLLGSPRVPVQGEMTDTWRDIHTRGLLVRGAHMWRFEAAEHRNVKKTVPWAFETIFSLIQSGKLKVDPLSTHVLPPDQAPQGYLGLKDTQDQYMSVVLDWRGL